MADYDAKEFEPILTPHFGVPVFTPSSACPHRGRYRRGSSLVCMSCHESGKDHMPIFRRVERPGNPVFRDMESDPEVKARWVRFQAFAETIVLVIPPSPPEMASVLPKETRRERRRRLFGAIVQTMVSGPPPAA